MFRTTHQLLTFFESVESINGRKKLQKMIHLLQSAGTPFPFKYRYHHFGPYSSQLQSEVNRLVAEDLLEEQFVSGAYIYKTTEVGKKFKKELQQDLKHSFPMKEELLDWLLKQNTSFLEIFSTYVYLIESGDSPTDAEEKARQLKPHLEGLLDQAIPSYEKHILQ